VTAKAIIAELLRRWVDDRSTAMSGVVKGSPSLQMLT
jgi:hypothetical protein